MKYLHLFPNEKFTESYISFINKHFNINEHLFLIFGEEVYYKFDSRKNVKKLSKNLKSLFLLIIKMNECKKIILHGLFSKGIVILLFLQPWLLKKSNWVIWGGDLYLYKYKNANFLSRCYEITRRFVIKNLGYLITYIEGDYKLTHLWYEAKGKWYYSIMYPSNLFKEYNFSSMKKDKMKKVIQIGNSADPTNNHIEIFYKLRSLKSESIEIICPLSYGDLQYRDKVIKEGKSIFGNKFCPIIDFMSFENYLEMLVKIDIAIFNHKRQQAMGNIITLLGLGKKVYIREDITTWQFCISHELKVFSSMRDFIELLDDISEDEKHQNVESIKKIFSEEELEASWNLIFS